MEFKKASAGRKKNVGPFQTFTSSTFSMWKLDVGTVPIQCTKTDCNIHDHPFPTARFTVMENVLQPCFMTRSSVRYHYNQHRRATRRASPARYQLRSPRTAMIDIDPRSCSVRTLRVVHARTFATAARSMLASYGEVLLTKRRAWARKGCEAALTVF